MVINVIKTVKQGSFVNNEEVSAPALAPKSAARAEGETVHTWIERMQEQKLLRC